MIWGAMCNSSIGGLHLMISGTTMNGEKCVELLRNRPIILAFINTQCSCTTVLCVTVPNSEELSDDGKGHNAREAIQVEVASSRPDHLPTLSAAKSSELSLLVKSPLWWRSGRFRQCYSDSVLQCAVDIEVDHTDSGIAMDCADRNRETPHLGD